MKSVDVPNFVSISLLHSEILGIKPFALKRTLPQALTDLSRIRKPREVSLLASYTAVVSVSQSSCVMIGSNVTQARIFLSFFAIA